MHAAADLNQRFARPGEVEFRVADHGALLAELTHALAMPPSPCRVPRS